MIFSFRGGMAQFWGDIASAQHEPGVLWDPCYRALPGPQKYFRILPFGLLRFWAIILHTFGVQVGGRRSCDRSSNMAMLRGDTPPGA